MQLLEIIDSRIIYLVRLRRPGGHLYGPESAAKMIARYSFVGAPTLQDFADRKDFLSFKTGKFMDTGIQELRLYNDGFIVESPSNTKILDAFIDDLLVWAKQSLGLEPIPGSKPERHHESSIVVRSKKDLMGLLDPLRTVQSELNRLLRVENYGAREFSPTGFVLESDATEKGSVRKENRFTVERRLNVPFSDNSYFSQAPLPTDAHLELLERVEALAP